MERVIGRMARYGIVQVSEELCSMESKQLMNLLKQLKEVSEELCSMERR